jgi:Ca2+-binding RTX toxin-like protein
MVATFIGTNGNDTQLSGFDYLYGADGDDVLASDRPGLDVVEGGRGNDKLFVKPAVNATGHIYGGDGNDVVFGAENADSLYGGEGNDLLVGSDYTTSANMAVQAVAATGDDYMEGGNGNDALYGFDGNDHIYGGDGDDRGQITVLGGTYNAGLFGGSGNDYLNGGAGDDDIWGGTGTDYIDGGSGFDYARYDYASTGVTASLDNPVINTGESAGDFYVSVEGLIGSAFNDTLIGGGDGNTILGLDGNDQIHGLGGNDALLGGNGDDQIFGGEGTDFIDGGIGFDYARYDFASSGVAISLATGSGTAGEATGDFLVNIEGLVGSFNPDFLVGDANNNTIFGQGGDDIIFGNEGADALYGGGGSDTFAFRAIDFQSGVYDRVKDFSELVGNQDAVTLIGVPQSAVALFDTPSGALITTTTLAGSGGVILEGFTVAKLADQIFFTT